MVLGDTAVFPEVPFRLVPGVLDPVDVVVATNEALLVVDPNVMEVRDIGGVVASPTVCIDDTVRASERRGFMADGIGGLTGNGVPGLIRLSLGAAHT